MSSYPHPWLMPDFWEFPTVSMGLGPIMGIYQARFNQYLRDRGIKDTSRQKVWVYVGDGETDEPETLGAITLAAREKLDNLIFVINCNLQRLDGPVRGNGKIIQELEALFRGAGWHVIKVIWGDDWDPLLAKDETALLARRMQEVVDGEYQKYTVMPGSYIREHFFGKYPELLEMVATYSDERLIRMRRGGHDPEKVYAAYKAAIEHRGQPTVILAKTIKGYGMGEAGEGRNIAHQQKKLNEEELLEFRSRFGIPISDDQVANAPFYKPAEDTAEMRYLRERRKALGGFVPSRPAAASADRSAALADYIQLVERDVNKEISTTMGLVRILERLCRDKRIGKYIVPIVPDESRTFGMEGMFRQVGIYSHAGQLYEPVDSDKVFYYKEAQDGQILEEGITEAGSMSSFIAAGTAYSSHGINMIPFFIYYSMFGFQRIGDLIWAACDMRAKGFMVGGTAGRTTLNGEGLQHQDGHSHLIASAFPYVRCYDPAFHYESAAIVFHGLQKLYEEGDNAIYYLTVVQRSLPDAGHAGRQRRRHHSGHLPVFQPRRRPVGASECNCSAAARSCGRHSRLRKSWPTSTASRVTCGASPATPSCVATRRRARAGTCCTRNCRRGEPISKKFWQAIEGPFIASSDYVRAVAEQLTPWIPGDYLRPRHRWYGTERRTADLRRHFEVDGPFIVLAALYQLSRQGKLPVERVSQAIRELGIDPEKANPLFA